MLKKGRKAPHFLLDDDGGQRVSLGDFKGRPIVLYFYPKDLTPGCTQEACDFRDEWSSLEKKGVVVLGVSADPVLKHRAFKRKYKLPFTLLSDGSKKVLKKYGVWQKKKFMGREFMGIVRSTFLIGGDGRIKKVWSPVSVEGHVTEVLQYL
jgi:peroxiredoxin Q/BCP